MKVVEGQGCLRICKAADMYMRLCKLTFEGFTLKVDKAPRTADFFGPKLPGHHKTMKL